MSKTIKRLLIATFISSCGFFSTWSWYKYSADDSEINLGSKRIAKLVSTTNEVQRKQAKKLIWQPAFESEDLYLGESIRTSSHSEARIEFIESKAAIDLEPDSAIMLEEADGKMALNFLKGNILVKSAKSNDGTDLGLTLKSGDKNIALGNSQVSLGKSTDSENIDLQVIKGSVTSDGKILDSSTQQKYKINVLSPMPGTKTYLDINKKETVLFKWTPLPQEYEIQLEAGDLRDKLVPIMIDKVSGDKGEIYAPMKIGKIYFRLSAKSNNPQLPEIKSSIIRTQFLAKIPPMPLSPENDRIMTLNKNENVQFLWSNPAGFSKIIFELATSANLQHKVLTETLDNITQFKFNFLTPGKYYWRISGLLEGKKEVVSSKVNSFQLKFQDELLPPELESPTNLERIFEKQIKSKGIVLSWKAVSGATNYKVVLDKIINSSENIKTKNNIIDTEGEFLQKTVINLKPGRYEWSVSAMNKNGERSQFSKKHNFTIEQLPTIDWADKKTEDHFKYTSVKPSVSLKWENGPHNAKSWRLTINFIDESKTSIVEIFNSTEALISLPKDSIYMAQVEALDELGQIIALSVVRKIQISALPLLPPPEYAANTPQIVESSQSGQTEIHWGEVSGAAKYVLTIKNYDGSISREVNSNEKQAQIKGLMPGQYKMTLKSVDASGRLGPEGDEKILRVPATSQVLAPKLKGIQVK